LYSKRKIKFKFIQYFHNKQNRLNINFLEKKSLWAKIVRKSFGKPSNQLEKMESLES